MPNPIFDTFIKFQRKPTEDSLSVGGETTIYTKELKVTFDDDCVHFGGLAINCDVEREAIGTIIMGFMG